MEAGGGPLGGRPVPDPLRLRWVLQIQDRARRTVRIVAVEHAFPDVVPRQIGVARDLDRRRLVADVVDIERATDVVVRQQ
jgi:hypothetical protein